MFKSLTEIYIGSISLSAILEAVILLIICSIFVKLLTRASYKLLEKSRHLDDSIKSFIASAVRIVLWIIALLIVASHLGIDVTSLVAVLSVAGLALSLAIQGLLENIFSGITLLLTRPFSVGDYVETGGMCGTVKSIGLFHTVINTLDNKQIYVPNGEITSSKIVNYTSEELRRVDLTINADYSCSTASVKEAISDAIGSIPQALKEPAPFIAIGAYGTSSIEYTVRVWAKSCDYWTVYYALNERIRDSFDAHGVMMSFDHVNVHILDK